MTYSTIAGYSLIDQSKSICQGRRKTEDGFASVDKVKALNPKRYLSTTEEMILTLEMAEMLKLHRMR